MATKSRKVGKRNIKEDEEMKNLQWCLIEGNATNEDIEVTNLSGTIIDFETSVQFMDDEIREELHNELAPCSGQEFFTTYEKAHEEKFGEEWELSKVNPVY